MTDTRDRVKNKKEEFAGIIDNMEETKETPKKRHYDTKTPCPSCGERIGFVQPDCPFCGESIPFLSDRAGKLLLSLGCLLALGFAFSIFYFWDEGGMLLSYLFRGLVGLAIAFALGERASRY